MASSQEETSKPVLGSVAVIGAGVSGLAAAYRLKVEGAAVTVFEAESISGGKVKSFFEDGFTWEKGPNTMTESNVEVSELIDGLHLREKQQYPVMQGKRYIVRDGKPERLPSNPLAFLGSRLLSAQAKFQTICEPFLWRRKQHNEPQSLTKDESVGEFLERHVGREVVDYIVDPFIAGTSGSDPDSLSMRNAFPDICNLEERYGSLIVGAIKSSLARKKSRQGGSNSKARGRSHTSFSFVGGLQTLTDAVSQFIGKDNLRYDTTVLSLACNQQGNPLRDSWKVSCSHEYHESKDQGIPSFDAVIMTAPLSDFQQMQMCKDGKPYSLDFIPKVIYQPLSVLVMAFKKEHVEHPLEGFGVLVPSKEQANGLKTLGTLFSSSMFPDRAPPDTMLFTSFFGGSRNRDLASRSGSELQAAAINDLQKLLGISGPPVFFRHVFWSRAFPQYGPGYDGVFDALQKLEEDLPGFFYAGNNRDGLAVGKAMASGYNAAGRVLDYLQSSGGRKLFTMASVTKVDH
ncbi:hypothetical protein GOP47_0021559 [Adiantum capillus-veneris]|uniref:Protoporphyrinogen oxidase n=1 Tax=Adiantum capillus-veneris TaxID=13818 RepID=A0A9D4U8L7_ADICA|nr:hypothetical protein GOP47_0021559 [Adiantum capillus-veneris]